MIARIANAPVTALFAVLLLAAALTSCGSGRDKDAGEEGFRNYSNLGDLGGAGSGGLPRPNALLWRASLQTLSFIPLQEVDPEAGVIITDWYVNPDIDNERFKLVVYILDSSLRADALKVSVFRQIRQNESAEWLDAAAQAGTSQRIEDAILTQARQYRLSTPEAG